LGENGYQLFGNVEALFTFNYGLTLMVRNKNVACDQQVLHIQ